MKRFMAGMALFIALSVYGSVPASAQFFFMSPDQVGKPAPEFTMKTISGKSMSLTQFRDGKRAILFFWATWCPHCRRELKTLNGDIKRLEQQGIKLATIDVGEDDRVVKRYVEKNKLNVEVFMDEDQAWAERYEILGLPTFFFIDENGIVQGVSHSMPQDMDTAFSGSV